MGLLKVPGSQLEGVCIIPFVFYLYSNVTTTEDLSRLQQQYDVHWQLEWSQLAAAGKLVELDLMWVNGWNPKGDVNAGKRDRHCLRVRHLTIRTTYALSFLKHPYWKQGQTQGQHELTPSFTPSLIPRVQG
jgi:hypothetical protein